jgi:hypothetical protein
MSKKRFSGNGVNQDSRDEGFPFVAKESKIPAAV